MGVLVQDLVKIVGGRFKRTQQKGGGSQGSLSLREKTGVSKRKRSGMMNMFILRRRSFLLGFEINRTKF